MFSSSKNVSNAGSGNWRWSRSDSKWFLWLFYQFIVLNLLCRRAPKARWTYQPNEVWLWKWSDSSFCCGHFGHNWSLCLWWLEWNCTSCKASLTKWSWHFRIRKNVFREFEAENNLKIWLHIDAAYGGPLFWIPEKRQYLQGIHLVDSVCINLSKVGLAGSEKGQNRNNSLIIYSNFWPLKLHTSPMWVRNRNDLVNSFVEQPDYLK